MINLIKRSMIWLWMICLVIFYHIFIIGLSHRISKWAYEVNKTNCLLEALRKYFDGSGFIVVSPSPYGNWIHRWWHTETFDVFTHYSPSLELVKKWDWTVRYLRLMPLTFSGYEEVSTRDGMSVNRIQVREDVLLYDYK